MNNRAKDSLIAVALGLSIVILTCWCMTKPTLFNAIVGAIGGGVIGAIAVRLDAGS